MITVKKKVKLDAFEQDIEDNFDKWLPVSKSERLRIESILDKARKNVSISLRINHQDRKSVV